MKSKTKTKNLVETVANILSEPLKEQGFSYVPKHSSFFREQGELSAHIDLIAVYFPGPWYRVTFNLGIASEDVERTYHDLFPEVRGSDRARTIRLYCVNVNPESSRHFNEIPGFWSLLDTEGIEFYSDQIRAFIAGYGLSWLKRYSRLDEVFEDLLPTPTPNHSTVHALERALIIAALTQDEIRIQKIADLILSGVPFDKRCLSFFQESTQKHPSL
ncbi:MAG: DUF4304 domain-containing protein [Candidatus Obscuribacterales bacterium]|nr:DUF4304 domain-containing protein [Candidatus Obscuribacterales bacterium]